MCRSGRTPRSGRAAELGEDTLAVMASTSEWIRSADTKASILAASLFAVLGFSLAATSSIPAIWKGGPAPTPQSWCQMLALVLSTLTLAALLAVLWPRTVIPHPNRFSWPWLAGADQAEVEERVRSSKVRAEGWQQAKVLAEIANQKHRCLKVAVPLWAISSVVVGVGLALPPS